MKEISFWKRVNKTDSCWIWMGNKHKTGYGLISLRRGRMVLAHRFAWELIKGQIPNGLNVCHNCDNPPCVNPNHLFLGTQEDNMKDCINKGRFVFPISPKGYRCITNEQAMEMYSLYKYAGAKQEELAEIYEIGQSSVSRIILKEKNREIL